MISIPSRRVGDLCGVMYGLTYTVKFPSPQGGSETTVPCDYAVPYNLVSIPSRRVGDRPIRHRLSVKLSVSIPSRRVGDLSNLDWLLAFDEVSIPSRRVGDWTMCLDLSLMR